MESRRRSRRLSRKFGLSYPVSFGERVYSFLAPILAVAVILIALKYVSGLPVVSASGASPYLIGRAIAATLGRLLVGYALAFVVSIPLAVWVNDNPLIERLLLPLFDVIQSVPVLAFFPIIIIFFIGFGFLNGAAVFIIFLSMLWNIVFNLVGGLREIPDDLKSAAKIFGLKGFAFVRRLLLPAAVPYLVTGSILAWAQGWNIIIVAEVLHTYIPHGTTSQDLFGVGSLLVRATSSGQNGLFILTIFSLVGFIAFFNLFVWQKLLRYAERFKFE
ncbi:MAG TPA: ABC transporter permease subunit [Candidatus Tyrphobacter sp.]|nr:ABC transporter permease subunit [Candidatus Tyrphobacter sp.]